MKKTIKTIVEKQMNTKVKYVRECGKGASGSVYRVRISSEPYILAVKHSKFYDNMVKEKAMLDFLSARVSYKVPKTYFLYEENGTAFLAMDFIKGISGKSKLIKFIPNRNRLKNSIIDALMNAQSVQNDRFGKYDDPVYDTWHYYYRNYFEEIYGFTKSKYVKNEIEAEIMQAVEIIDNNFDKIFLNTSGKACLCHGDFWMPNLIIDFWKSELAGAVDPFDMLWAEPEYELFCLTLGFGETLGLYEEYKKRNQTSVYCDLKVEIYALCNELNWYILLGEMGHDYLLFRAKRLIEKAERIGVNIENQSNDC